MISIIICSINPERCEKTKQNLLETIGIENEIIIHDNRHYQWGICKVYNYCASFAKYKYLCFIHEDVFITTVNWGKKLVEIAENIENCGVIGFAGGLQVPKNFSSWGPDDVKANVCYGLNDKTFEFSKANYKYHLYINKNYEHLSKVLCIDGLFQFVKKSIWENIKYDELTFKGFHCYDADFSFAVSQNYNNYIIFDIDIYHDSSGNQDNDYIESIFLFQKKWIKQLPKFLIINNKLKYFRAELRHSFYLYSFCKLIKYKINKYFYHIIKINNLFFFILLLFYIPIKIINNNYIKLLKRI